MASFGETIRQQRESRKITLAEVAAATRISRRYLEALERNDFDDLPGEVFNKGYVRAFAEFIGADPEAMVAAYLREGTSDPDSRSSDTGKILDGLRRAVEHSAVAAEPKPWWRGRPAMAAGGALGLALLVVVAWWLLGGEPEVLSVPAGEVAAPRETREPAAVEEVAPPRAGEVAAPAPVEDDRPAGPWDAIARGADVGATDPALPPSERRGAERGARRSAPTASSTEPSTQAASAQKAPAVVAQAEATPRSPAPPPVAPAEAAPARLRISAFGVGGQVVDRELRGEAELFVEGDTVWFWTRVEGGRRGDRIRHVWLRDGREISSIRLNVGGSFWRTYSKNSLRAGSRGDWAVEARDAQGRVLARSEFRCVRPGG